ncbi:hypothetical protein Scep_022227 [Stephania cephalantha]|uniref:Uncharacterized protein n=1 Tax=Stephania cephalantha TaxID=152367 RepID=A0AAP0FE22_9MAGN
MELRFSRFWPEIVSPDFIDLPKLKALNMSSVAFRDGKGISNLIASCPSLEHLFLLENGKDSWLSFIELSRLDSVSITMPFDYKNGHVPFKAMNNIPKDQKKEYVRRATQLAGAIHNVQSLTLVGPVLEVFMLFPFTKLLRRIRVGLAETY